MGTYICKQYRRPPPSIATAGRLIAKLSFEAADSNEAISIILDEFFSEYNSETDFAILWDEEQNQIWTWGKESLCAYRFPKPERDIKAA